MNRKRYIFHRTFIVASSIVLLVLGAAKLVLGFGPMNDLWVLDPIFHVKLRLLMQVAGVTEISLGVACLILPAAKERTALLLLAWLSTSLVAYRYGLWQMDWKRPCNCMGYLTKPLHLSPQAADNVTKAILACLLIGSYACLYGRWKHGTTSTAPNLSSTTTLQRIEGEPH